MVFESFLIPFIVGIVTNGTSNELFQEVGLKEIVEELYYKSVDEFNSKYKNLYCGAYDNFLTRQENLEIVMKAVISFNDITELENLNVSDFSGKPTPKDVVSDFISIFHENLNEDERLAPYRNVREHYFLTKSILSKIEQLKEIRFRKFVSPEEYFHENIMENEAPISKLNRDTQEVFDALKSANIVIIESFRGFGKTETLRHLSISDSVKEQFDLVVIMRHGVRNIIDAIQTELYVENKYLIVIDDSELCVHEVRELLNFMKSFVVQCKIILSVQTYAIKDITSLISSISLTKETIKISLNNWKNDDYIELLRQSAGVVKYKDEDIVVNKYPSPSLIRLIGEKSGNTVGIDFDVIFYEYKELIENDAYNILKDYMSREDCNKFLFSICCTVPFDISDEQYRLINESLQSKYDIKTMFHLLQKGGVIRKIGYKFRFFPDIKGDIFFAYSLNEEKYVHIIDYWIKFDEGKVLENLKEARLISDVNINEKLQLIINEWTCSTGYFEQSKNLEVAKAIVNFMPDSVINLLYCYLDYAKEKDYSRYFNLSSDNFGPVILKLWRYSENIEAILEIIVELEKYQLDGNYSNYKVSGLVSWMFSPANVNLNRIMSSLEVLQRWISEDNDVAIVIFKYAASEILKGSHEVTRSIINGIEYGQVTLILDNNVIRIREKCIEIIEFLINNKLGYRSIEVIESICDEIGNMSFNDMSTDGVSLNNVIKEERIRLVELLGTTLLTTTDKSVQIVIDRILLHWWAGQYSGSDSAEKYLRDFNRSGEYLFAKYYVDLDYRIICFEEIEAIAPAELRREWFAREVMHNINDRRNDSQRIAEMLSKKITTINGLYEFLNYEANIIDNFKSIWSSPQIFEAWCNLNNELFIDFIKSDEFNNIKENFKAKILSVVSKIGGCCDISIVETYLNSDKELSNNEILEILALLIHPSLSESVIVGVIDKIIGKHILEYPARMIHYFYFIFKDRERIVVCKLLLKILNEYPDDLSAIREIGVIFHHFGQELKNSDQYKELKDKVIALLIKCESFGYHENQLLVLILNDINEAISFLANRLVCDEINGYRKIPIQGFSFLNNYISDVDEYGLLLDKINDLQKDNKNIGWDICDILRPLFMKEDGEGKLLGVQLLRNYCREKDDNMILILLNAFVFDMKTIEVFAESLRVLKDLGLGEVAENYILKQRFPKDGYHRKIGDKSPEKLSLIIMYSELYKLLPYGKLKNTTETCIEYLKRDIEKDLIDDETLLNPR